jgi:hypothetical protein
MISLHIPRLADLLSITPARSYPTEGVRYSRFYHLAFLEPVKGLAVLKARFQGCILIGKLDEIDHLKCLFPKTTGLKVESREPSYFIVCSPL